MEPAPSERAHSPLAGQPRGPVRQGGPTVASRRSGRGSAPGDAPEPRSARPVLQGRCDPARSGPGAGPRLPRHPALARRAAAARLPAALVLSRVSRQGKGSAPLPQARSVQRPALLPAVVERIPAGLAIPRVSRRAEGRAPLPQVARSVQRSSLPPVVERPSTRPPRLPEGRRARHRPSREAARPRSTPFRRPGVASGPDHVPARAPAERVLPQLRCPGPVAGSAAPPLRAVRRASAAEMRSLVETPSARPLACPAAAPARNPRAAWPFASQSAREAPRWAAPAATAGPGRGRGRPRPPPAL